MALLKSFITFPENSLVKEWKENSAMDEYLFFTEYSSGSTEIIFKIVPKYTLYFQSPTLFSVYQIEKLSYFSIW